MQLLNTNNKVGLMPITTPLTLEQKIAAFLEKVNSATGLKEVTLQDVTKQPSEGAIDFEFRINGNAFETECMVLKPNDETRAIMDAASKEFFGSELLTNNLYTAFWVIPA